MGFQNVQNSILSSTFTLFWCREMLRAIYLRVATCRYDGRDSQQLHRTSHSKSWQVFAQWLHQYQLRPVIGLHLPRFRLQGSDWDGLWCNARRSLRVTWHWLMMVDGCQRTKNALGIQHRPTHVWGLPKSSIFYLNHSHINQHSFANFKQRSGWTRNVHQGNDLKSKSYLIL